MAENHYHKELMSTRKRPQAHYDVGELWVELSATKIMENLAQNSEFKRLQGGSPAQVVANMLRLGNTAALVACIGTDAWASFLLESLKDEKIDTKHLVQDTEFATSLLVRGRSLGETEMISYRHADTQLRREHLPDSLIQHCNILHTTCFALTRKPAQATILEAAQRAYHQGIVTSIDMNYSQAMGKNTEDLKKNLQSFCQTEPLVKISREDAEQLLGKEYGSELDVLATLHAWGARLVCLTMGKEGSMVSDRNERQFFNLASHKVRRVVDVDGAGDAYWAGFLSTWLDEQPLTLCTQVASKLASMKLQKAGSLPDFIDKKRLYK